MVGVIREICVFWFCVAVGVFRCFDLGFVEFLYFGVFLSFGVLMFGWLCYFWCFVLFGFLGFGVRLLWVFLVQDFVLLFDFGCFGLYWFCVAGFGLFDFVIGLVQTVVGVSWLVRYRCVVCDFGFCLLGLRFVYCFRRFGFAVWLLVLILLVYLVLVRGLCWFVVVLLAWHGC